MSGGGATVREWSDAIKHFAGSWPERGANLCADAIDKQSQADTGGDQWLSNHRGGAAFAQVTDVGLGYASVTADGSMQVWSILEHGTKAHTIRPRRVLGSVLSTPYGPRPMVRVSGMAAKQTWSKGVEAGTRLAERDAATEFSEAVK